MPKASFTVAWGVKGTVSFSTSLTSTPSGLFLPGTCSAQTCKPTTATMTKGSR